MARPLEQIENHNDEILLEQGKRIRALHNIISRPDLTFEQQIDETLRLGCQLLGTEIGKIGRQDPENNESEFLNVVVMSELPVKRGMVLPLDKTFCHVTFSSPEAIAISHVAESEYRDHPAAEFLGMESYIGTSINVHGKKFGTINFANRTPVKISFTEADKDLVNLMGSWISVMMERQLDAEELEKSKQAAEAANQAKSSFLANMSHEIRTPLTSIIGFAELSLDDETPNEQHVEALQTIQQSSKHLLSLINDVLDFSKIEAGELDIDKDKINLQDFVSEVQSMVTGQARRKGIEFSINNHFPLPEEINSDPLRLKQVLLNLCSNAIKFTDRGKVALQLNYDRSNQSLTISVTDSGIGMTEEQLGNLFKAFKQADPSISRRFGGTGLGLSLSKRLAELMDYTLEAESTYGEGSCFKLTIPDVTANKLIDNADQVVKKKSGNPYAHSMSGNVLLAEDNELNQKLIEMYLRSMGLTVSIASHGAEAYKLATENNYDLIFMDMQMPIMSGVAAVKKLRMDNYAGPIIMLTANATAEDRNRCLQAGSNDYLTKPINREKLYTVSQQHLDKK